EGEIINNTWKWLRKQYEYVDLDQFIIMPNHIHGIICIRRGGSRTAPTRKRKPLGRLIGAFKTVSTKQINLIRQTSGNQFWQRNYYEHIIRDEDDLARIREYIINNPAQWEHDDYYVK
ncbi:transposase, partial [bacterium]|nr:transposase [bacterium]